MYRAKLMFFLTMLIAVNIGFERTSVVPGIYILKFFFNVDFSFLTYYLIEVECFFFHDLLFFVSYKW